MSIESRSAGDIVGTWRLGSCVVRRADGEVLPVYGEDADGVLMYWPNGYMSVHVSNRKRPHFVEDDFLRGTCDELRRAFEGYLSYFGSYEYRAAEGCVLHTPIESLLPNWSGTTHTRYTVVEGDTLHIRTPTIIFGGDECVMELVWNRSEGP